MTSEPLWTDVISWLCGRSDSPKQKAVLRKIKFRECNNIPGDLETGDKSRYFAHTGHFGNTVCVSKDFSRLPVKNRIGILIHEIGHILSGVTDEPSADLYILDNFGIQIQYKGAKELQYIDVDFK